MPNGCYIYWWIPFFEWWSGVGDSAQTLHRVSALQSMPTVQVLIFRLSLLAKTYGA